VGQNEISQESTGETTINTAAKKMIMIMRIRITTFFMKEQKNST